MLSSALLSPARACLLQLSVPRAALAESQAASLRSAIGTALGEAMHAALAAAQLSMQDLLCVRAYFCVSRMAQQEAAAWLADGFERGCSGAEERPAPVYVPVCAVGDTPAADAVLHVVFLALKG